MATKHNTSRETLSTDEDMQMDQSQAEETDLFADIEDDAPLPRIKRDVKFEEEIEQEKYIPVAKVIEDMQDQALDPVRMYLSEISRHDLLTTEQQVALAKRIKAGLQAEEYLAEPAMDLSPLEIDELQAQVADGKRAQAQLTQSNLRLVVSVAKRYIGRGLNFQDLIQEGNVGLLRAVEKFDHTLGFKFSTYATWWIRQAISRAIANQARTIRLPVHMVEMVNRQIRTYKWLQQELGRDPTLEEVALEMEFLEPDVAADVRQALQEGRPVQGDLKIILDQAMAKVQSIHGLSRDPVSLDTPVGMEENSYLGDFIKDDNVLTPMDSASHQLLKEQMSEILNNLTERERNVLIMRFGLEDGISHTLEDVGKAFNITQERTRQIEAKALRKLRHPQRSRKLLDYLK